VTQPLEKLLKKARLVTLFLTYLSDKKLITTTITNDQLHTMAATKTEWQNAVCDQQLVSQTWSTAV